jgi:two-component system phosphate regulon sensor histidine kinase PhoR
MKDASPNRLALVITALLCAVIALATLAVFLWLGRSGVLYFGAIVIAVLLPVGYFITRYFIRTFLYDRIRLIYKTIHQKKLQEQGISVDMDVDVLTDVESKVANWTDDRNEEIQRLKEQEAYRREFIGNLGHELKTPVFSIQGYILTLLEGGLDDPTVNREFLQRAANGVDRMTHILEDLDVITQLEAGHLNIDLAPVNVVDLAADVMEGLEMKAKNRSVVLKFDKEYERDIMVMADAGRIGQVLTNLVNNAVNYGKEGGEVEIRFFHLGEQILIEVSDDGLGIAEAHLTRLFERFYRIDKSRSRHIGGTGLGLAIVKHIVEGHQQTINVRSSEGVGSTFSFTLDKARA